MWDTACFIGVLGRGIRGSPGAPRESVEPVNMWVPGPKEQNLRHVGRNGVLELLSLGI